MKKTVFLIAVLAFAFACSKNEDPKSKLAQLITEREKLNVQIAELEEKIAASDTTKITEKPLSVYVSPLVISEFNHFIEVHGKVDGEENLAVSPKSMGVVSRILVKEGDNVRAGQVLAELDDAILKNSLEQTKTQFDLVKTIYLKQKALWEQNIGSEIQYLDAKNKYESLQKAIATQEEQISMMKIKSPISGSVEEIPIKIGQAVQPGVPAFRVVNFSSIKVLAEVAESYATKVNQGDRVFIRFPDTGQEVPSTLKFASKYINPVNRTFTVESRLSASGISYRANMLAIIRLNDYSNPKAIQVPINIIQEGLTGKYVAVARQEGSSWIARQVPVTRGRIYNGMAEITNGLLEGDQLITAGYQGIKNGQLLEISKK